MKDGRAQVGGAIQRAPLMHGALLARVTSFR